jgi:tetratricopeptide (TPR) repeat protein
MSQTVPSRSGSRPARPIVAALALALLFVAILASPPGSRAEMPADAPQEGSDAPVNWEQVLEAYNRDPEGTRGLVLSIESEFEGPLPPMARVYIADANLRAGRIDRAQTILRETLESNPGYPWDVFARLGLGATSIMRGDTGSAEFYFSEVANADEQSAQLFGNLGLGHTYLASDRPLEAKEAFDAAASNKVVDPQFRQAGKFGSATALYAAGDYEGAAEAFDAIAASDPKGQIGLDARFAAARARLAAGDRDVAVEALEGMESRCATKKRGRVPRSLRNLDGRAVGRAWLRNYRHMSWYDAMGSETTMYTIGGCDLARSTLRQVRAGANMRAAPSRSAVSARSVSSARPAAGGPAAAAGAGPARCTAAGAGWLPWLGGLAALAALAFLLLRRGSTTGQP